ncbi:MAG TPA: hypothetical protein VGH28_10200 [Polyangiaceae bacterium]|jgi:hypothetical protein
MMAKPRPQPETLPELPAVDGEASGKQNVAAAWDEIYARMWAAFKSRDYARAVDLGERFAQRNPQHAASKLFVEECRTLLESQLAKELAPLDRALVLRAPLGSFGSIDPRAAFILSQIDGRLTIEDLVDLTPMPRVAALRIVGDALAAGIVGFV